MRKFPRLDLKKGAYTASVKRRYGSKGFTESGRIKVSIIKKDVKESGVLGRRARLALTFRGFKRR